MLFLVIKAQLKQVRRSAFLLSIKLKEQNRLYCTLQKGVYQHSRGCGLKIFLVLNPKTPNSLSLLIHAFITIALQLLYLFKMMLVKGVFCMLYMTYTSTSFHSFHMVFGPPPQNGKMSATVLNLADFELTEINNVFKCFGGVNKLEVCMLRGRGYLEII